MLLSFRFANHRSFRDEQQLNLMPVYGSDAGQPTNLEPVRTVGIFGANASGKSNCLNALAFMRRMVFRSDRDVEPGRGIFRDPFLLSPQSRAEPSRYVVDLVLDGVHHTYGFTIDDERVLEEWLYQYPLKKKRRIFERDRQKFSWGEHSGKRHDLENVARITAPTALFLSTVARFSMTGISAADPLYDVYHWFQGNRVRSISSLRFFGSGEWPEDENDQRIIVELMRVADVGIERISLRERPEPTPIPDSVRRVLGESLSSADFDDMGTRDLSRLEFLHRGSDGLMLSLGQESTGTLQLLDLALDAARILRVGGMMTIDEIDASLHPILTAKLIGLFQSPTTNPQGSQLVFTSHDAALLGTIDGEEVLRRDEIWFTEKHDDGASVLYPLSDFKPRKEGENRQRRYMNGNYGAVPDLSTYLFERAVASRGDGETTSS